MTFADGIKYEGGWKNFRMDGKGSMTFTNGFKFIGDYKEGKQNGRGTLYRADGVIVQQGVWSNSKFIGAQ
jgi:hypothetical protein